MSASRMAVSAFCAYADSDETSCQQLEKHLSALKQQGLITFWHHQQIGPGQDRATAINTHLSTASIILLLISADFIASDFCAGPEIKHVLQRHKQGKV